MIRLCQSCYGVANGWIDGLLGCNCDASIERSMHDVESLAEAHALQVEALKKDMQDMVLKFCDSSLIRSVCKFQFDILLQRGQDCSRTHAAFNDFLKAQTDCALETAHVQAQ